MGKLIDEVLSIKGTKKSPGPGNWFSSLDPDMQVQVVELCKDYLTGGVVKQKFARTTDLYNWLKTKGIVKIQYAAFRRWVVNLSYDLNLGPNDGH